MIKSIRKYGLAAKILCVVLSLSIAASAICVAAFAFSKEEPVTPVILVPGLAGTALVDGDGVPVFSKDNIVKALGLKENEFGEICTKDLSKKVTTEDIKKILGDKLSEVVAEIIEPLRMDVDGTPYYKDVKPIVSGAKNTSLTAFKEADLLDYIPYASSEFLDMESIGQRIGDDNVFNFTYDWRLDYCELAKQFDEYIDEVLELTGAEKVSIYAISQGCMLTSEYMYEYAYKEVVDNVVLDTPAIGGTSVAADLFSEKLITVDYKNAISIICEVLHTELNVSQLADIIPLDFITQVLNNKRFELLAPLLVYAPAIVELVPCDRLNEVKTSVQDLGYDLNAVAYEKINYFYEQFPAHIDEMFKSAEDHGFTVSIKVCTGKKTVCTTDAYGDIIIDTSYACGATCAPFGKTFDSSYVQAVDNGHNSISPDRTIDLSTGYIPDRTWVINDLGHGQVEWCPKSLELVETLLYTHDLKNAYSSFEFPQFMDSYSSTSDINIKFANTNCMFLQTNAENDYELIVTNTSKKTSVFVEDISSSLAKVDMGFFGIAFIPPQGSISFKVKIDDSVKIPSYDSFKVSYYAVDTPTAVLEKDFGFTILDNYNGVLGKAEAIMENNLILNIVNRIVYLVSELIQKIK